MKATSLLFSSPSPDLGWALSRISVGAIMMYYGSQKLFGAFGGNGFEATVGFFTSQMGIPAPFAILAIIAEFFGGLGLVAGLLSRVAALGVFSTMVVATLVNLSKIGGISGLMAGKIPDVNGVWFPLILGLVSLGVIISGPGKFSLDARISARNPE